MQLSLIVAFANQFVIGRGNKLPWHIPEDLRWFKRVTMGKSIIMGRKTYESIGKPLPGRTNIVITTQADFQADGVKVVHSLDEAEQLAQQIALIDGSEEALIIGGAQIYQLALPKVHRMYVTQVYATVEGDTYFPDVDWQAWTEIGRDQHPETDDQYAYDFVVYQQEK